MHEILQHECISIGVGVIQEEMVIREEMSAHKTQYSVKCICNPPDMGVTRRAKMTYKDKYS